MLRLKFKYVKIHPKAVTPNKIAGNLGFDLSVVRDEDFTEYYGARNLDGSPRILEHRYNLQPKTKKIFHTGLKIAIPVGYGVVFWDRSGMSAVKGLTKLAGCIDCTYRGEWLVCLYNLSDEVYPIVEGDRIIQCIILPDYQADFEEDKELDDTIRGEKGFGASGR